MSDVSTTACAILGLIAAKEGSAYELVRRMERNYRFFWPRAQSHFYAEIKRLVEARLATASDEGRGRRPRTVYRITKLGREAIAAWLERPVQAPAFEFEGLLRVAYGDFGSKKQLVRCLSEIHENARQALAVGAAIAQDYAEGKVELPHRSHLGQLLWQYLWIQHQARLEWSQWAIAQVNAWPSTRAGSANLAQSRVFFSKVAARVSP